MYLWVHWRRLLEARKTLNAVQVLTEKISLPKPKYCMLHCTAKMWLEKFLWYFVAASLPTSIFGECYLHVAFLNVSLWAKKRKAFWGEGMPVIIATDLVWKPDCFSDIQAPEAAESQTTVLYLTALMFEELIPFFKFWNFSLKQTETIRTYKMCSLFQFHKQKSRK